MQRNTLRTKIDNLKKNCRIVEWVLTANFVESTLKNCKHSIVSKHCAIMSLNVSNLWKKHHSPSYLMELHSCNSLQIKIFSFIKLRQLGRTNQIVSFQSNHAIWIILCRSNWIWIPTLSLDSNSIRLYKSYDKYNLNPDFVYNQLNIEH